MSVSFVVWVERKICRWKSEPLTGLQPRENCGHFLAFKESFNFLRKAGADKDLQHTLNIWWHIRTEHPVKSRTHGRKSWRMSVKNTSRFLNSTEVRNFDWKVRNSWWVTVAMQVRILNEMSKTIAIPMNVREKFTLCMTRLIVASNQYRKMQKLIERGT